MATEQKPEPKAKEPVGIPAETSQPKTESSAEYEGATSKHPTADTTEVKTETSSSSGE